MIDNYVRVLALLGVLTGLAAILANVVAYVTNT